MSAQVWELLDSKGREIISISRTASVYEAVVLMSEKNVGCLLVQTKSGSLSGICSERDVFRNVILGKKNPARITVADVMTPKRKLITVTQNTTITDCMEMMTENRVRHLPVLDNESGALQGLISIGDVIKTLSTERELMIRQLEHYIGSSL